MQKKNLDQKFILEKKLEHFSEKKVGHLETSTKSQPNPIENPLGKSFNLTLISKGKSPKLLYLGAQTELSELPVHEHIRNEL